MTGPSQALGEGCNPDMPAAAAGCQVAGSGCYWACLEPIAQWLGSVYPLRRLSVVVRHVLLRRHLRSHAASLFAPWRGDSTTGRALNGHDQTTAPILQVRA